MAISFSPLRYPGGKQILAKVLAHLIKLNGCEGGVYVEPYAGGASAALALLFEEYVRRIVINDADPRIIAFWDAALNRTDRLARLIRDTPLTVEEWRHQREIYLRPDRHSRLKLGFAAFYLNRCNRSGIIGNAGLIGGLKQTGKWKLDARYNREDLVRRVERIACYRDRIQIFGLDATDFLRREFPQPSRAGQVFVYLDPPYYAKGSKLYLNHYSPEDHANVAAFLAKSWFPWVMSYDDVPQIKKLYESLRKAPFNLGYSARERKVGKEIMIVPDHLVFPVSWTKQIPDQFITAADRVPAAMPTEATAVSNSER